MRQPLQTHTQVICLGAVLLLCACREPVAMWERPGSGRAAAAPDSFGGGPTVTLLAPPEGAVIAQNDSSIGCPPHEARGYGFQIQFDWTDVALPDGTAGYYLFVKNRSAMYPMIDWFVAESEFDFTACNGFVIDRNMFGWYWLVQPVDAYGSVGAWSDTANFSFAPCRLPDGRRCWAPPESQPR